MGNHTWEVHGPRGTMLGSYSDEHWALAWLYQAIDGMTGPGWGVLTTPEGRWRVDRDQHGEITWTAL